MITCRFLRSRIERSVIAESYDAAVVKHLALCPGCREVHADLTQMHQSLGGLAASLPSGPTTEKILARIVDVQRLPSRTSGKLLVTGGAVLAMLILAIWMSSRPVGGPGIPPIAIHDELKPGKIEYTPIDKQKDRLVKVSPSVKITTPRLVRSDFPVGGHRSNRGAITKNPSTYKKTTVNRVNRIELATQWARLGESYESQGDYASAATAYRIAGTENKQYDYVIGAGRNSESAGQVESAIEIYADLLSTHTSSAPQGDQGAG